MPADTKGCLPHDTIELSGVRSPPRSIVAKLLLEAMPAADLLRRLFFSCAAASWRLAVRTRGTRNARADAAFRLDPAGNGIGLADAAA